jgi:glutathione S-transferase
MSDELVFYTNPMSRGRIVRWMLEEVGQPYRTELLDYGTTMKAPAYLAINPMGKVPALKHGDVIVTETAAICAYLADAFPQAGLAPTTHAPERGTYLRWMFFGAGPLEQASVNKALGVVVPEERKRMAGYGSLDDVVNTLNAHLQRSPYFAGTAFTAADIYTGGQIGWLTHFGIIDKRPSFVDYVARISSRPAFKRAQQLDEALIPAKD